MRLVIGFIYLLCHSLTAFGGPLPATITVCGDGSEWPPYIYWQRDAKGAKTNQLVGLTVELLNRAVKKSKIKVNFELPPWKRCLAQVELGQTYDIALDSSYSQEREKKFLMTQYYYEISPMLFYLKSQYKNGFPKFSNVKELLQLGNVCGLSGYNYEGFISGLKNSDIDTGTKNFNSVVKKTTAGGCIGFFARHEILKGFKKLGNDHGVGKNLIGVPLPNSKKEKFYMLISRNISYGKELKAILDLEFKKLRNDKLLIERYLN